VIIVQEIRVYWDKSARSGSEAELRNSVPESFEINLLDRKDAIHQVLRFDGSNQYSVPTKTTVASFKPKSYGNLFGAIDVRDNKEGVIVSYRYSDLEVGAPRRTVAARDVLNLESNQWGRIVHTGRFSGYSNWESWYYMKVTYNIAKIPDSSRGIVEIKNPIKKFSDIGKLR